MLIEWRPDMISARTKRIDRALEEWFVAEDDGEIVGFIEHGLFSNWDQLADFEHFTDDDAAPFIRSIFVSEGYRDHGVGGALLDGWIASLSNVSVPLAVVMPDQSSDPRARVRFFERYEFRWMRPDVEKLQPWLMARPLTGR
ncbi:GNAT family N-acetyltransferase [Cellulosimicrobium aquatile]|uniref:GNAT family N-acetyltransferase n=1 Tax=Cellulosimicrobium aquatile TaxID=1612203 RepID=UPI001459C584|nr:GNAT family N-acetyltransferase [Cellulosimicrobium aquatile]NMF29605.1 GNAT family N-acetyltransferase [Cellulosimicrobium aquatile]